MSGRALILLRAVAIESFIACGIACGAGSDTAPGDAPTGGSAAATAGTSAAAGTGGSGASAAGGGGAGAAGTRSDAGSSSNAGRDASTGDDSGVETDAGPTTPDAGPLAPHVLEPYATTSHWNEHELYPAIRAAGVRMIRVDVSWNNVQPSPGGFDWSNIDQAMTAAADADLKVLAVLGYTNSWASSDDGGGGEETQYAPKEEYDDEWAAYIEATVSRYADQVAAWEIWNEPDHDNFLRIGDSTWAGNHHSGESAVDIKRLEYQHLLELALAAPSLAGKTITTSGFAEGGDWDTGMRAWLASQDGFLNRFSVASFHCYGFPSYQRLIDVPASYRQTQEAIAKADPWPFWITEHGIPQMGVDGGVIKTYLVPGGLRPGPPRSLRCFA